MVYNCVCSVLKQLFQSKLQRVYTCRKEKAEQFSPERRSLRSLIIKTTLFRYTSVNVGFFKCGITNPHKHVLVITHKNIRVNFERADPQHNQILPKFTFLLHIHGSTSPYIIYIHWNGHPRCEAQKIVAPIDQRHFNLINIRVNQKLLGAHTHLRSVLQ